MKSKARICVPVCVKRAAELAGAVKRAAALGDVIEIRFDCLEPAEVVEALKRYGDLREAVLRPFIVTFRPQNQGGFRAIDKDERIQFWTDAQLWLRDQASDDFADIEAELLFEEPAMGELIDRLGAHRVICSHHDFSGIPKDLEQLYERMAATSARVIKIAAQANDATDCILIFKLLDRAQCDGRDLIAIAMGQAGVMTRILGPSRGSRLTYGSLDEDSATAPGQLSARELREPYRIDRIDQQTEIMGLVGRPVGHSISPHLHNAAFAKANLNAVFVPFEVNDIDAFIRRMVRPSSREIEWNLRGLSVTAPHKSAVMGHLDWIEPGSKEIGAVNTIVFSGGQLHGYNTDAGGFIAPLQSRIASLESLRCAVIGAGGAARAAAWALRNCGADVAVFARDCDQAKAFSDQFKVACHDLAAADLRGFNVVVNATPLGTRGEGEDETPAIAEQLRGVRLAYDLVYNPLETRFMREARAAGCETIGGLEMLIAQAVEQFKLWTGKTPDIEAMRAAAERALERSVQAHT
jgi:3-dehydroquinate dehydratase/shikimate dehydrogenase